MNEPAVVLRCETRESPIAFQAAGEPVLFRWAQDRKILTPVPQHHIRSERKGAEHEATDQRHHEVMAKPPATLTLEEERAELAAEIHAEEAGQHGATAKDQAQDRQSVDGLGVFQLIEVVNELGHVPEL